MICLCYIRYIRSLWDLYYMNRHGPLYCNLCSFGKSSPKIRKKPVRRQEFEKSLTPLWAFDGLRCQHSSHINRSNVTPELNRFGCTSLCIFSLQQNLFRPFNVWQDSPKLHAIFCICKGHLSTLSTMMWYVMWNHIQEWKAEKISIWEHYQSFIDLSCTLHS